MVTYNPFDRATTVNPFPVYRQLRDEAPVYRNERVGFWALSRFEDVLRAFLDPTTYSSAHGNTIEYPPAGNLVDLDPPEHDRHRSALVRVFTPRAVARLEPVIREVAGELLETAREHGRLDVVADFSARLPMYVIAEMLGLPEELREPVHVLSSRILAAAEVQENPTLPEDAMAAMVELDGLLREIVRARVASPRDDLISQMAALELVDDGGRSLRMSEETLVRRTIELAIAGHETTAKLVANGAVALAWYPDQRRQIVNDPSLARGAVEETLRWDPPSHYQARWTTRDVELHGVTIPAEQRVILVNAAANHDERVFGEPELFDIHRHIDRHLGFGFGAHLCLGAALARLETRVAFEELLARFPDYEIVEDGIERAYGSNVRGLSHLPITVDSRR